MPRKNMQAVLRLHLIGFSAKITADAYFCELYGMRQALETATKTETDTLKPQQMSNNKGEQAVSTNTPKPLKHNDF